MKEYIESFNFSDECREDTINALFEEARSCNMRGEAEIKWKTREDFYKSFENARRRRELLTDGDNMYSDDGDTFKDITLTDAYIQCESQVEVNIPEPVFTGRDHDKDFEKAKQREYVVKYILEKNDLQSKNTANERSMIIYGDSFAKVYYDDSISYDDTNHGDIKVDFISVDDIYIDPCATDFDDAEYVCYTYFMHKRKAQRLFGSYFKKKKIDIEEIASETRSEMEALHRGNDELVSSNNEVMILEFWYRNDDGNIALSMLVNGHEFKHIDNYWERTGEQNKSFPFVQFYRIKDQNNFYNISELDVILPLVENASRILSRSLESDDMQGNDIILAEENALAEGEEITNEAGAIIYTKDGKINSVRRLGGMNNMQTKIPDIQFLQQEIQRTTRNYESNMGNDQSARTNTASGLAQLRADAATQTNKKGYDRLMAWKRLFQLIDWAALEFYDEDRHIFIGTPAYKRNQYRDRGMIMPQNLDPKMGDIYFTFNSDNIAQVRNRRMVGIDSYGMNQFEEERYYPLVDCTVNATSGIEQSKSFTVQTLQWVMQTPITIDNYKIAIEIIRTIGIPQSEMIIDQWLEMFEPEMIDGLTPDIMQYLTPQQMQQLRQNPQLIEMAKNLAAQKEAQAGMPTDKMTQAQTPPGVSGVNKFA